MSRFVLPFSFLILFNIQLPVFSEKRDAKRLPVKVFILAGQSNMEGHGLIKGRPDQKGTLEELVNNPKTSKKFNQLIKNHI